jgi:hypothetical protein
LFQESFVHHTGADEMLPAVAGLQDASGREDAVGQNDDKLATENVENGSDAPGEAKSLSLKKMLKHESLLLKKTLKPLKQHLPLQQ